MKKETNNIPLHTEVIRYGEILTDDNFTEELCVSEDNFRVRTIAYNGKIYYHKMVNGEIIEFKELKS